MAQYRISVEKDEANRILDNIMSIAVDPFPIESRTEHHLVALALTLYPEELVFLSLSYNIKESNEITIVDVVGNLINA